MNTYFSEIKKNFGFGCMRLPMHKDAVDYDEFIRMVDVFIDNGFNYFDTAHGYLGGKSEIALRECLTSRYPRESYILTNKLSTHNFNRQEEIRPLFENQLAACGVEYFDFYLMHAQDKNIKSATPTKRRLNFWRKGILSILVFPFTTKGRCWNRY